MSSILVVYHTTDGHTGKICRHLQQAIEHDGHRVEVVCLNHDPQLELDAYDKLVIGASIRYGKHNPKVYDFIGNNSKILSEKPSAFFSVNMVARKPQKRTADTNPYVRKFLKQIPWQPDRVAVFAGKIDYPRYSFMDRNIIHFIMWLTKGPTDPATVKEFTDWEQVEAFAHVISAL